MSHSQAESWEVVIGMEVHAQISSKSKLFSGSSTSFPADPNTQVSFVDAAFPGMLPVLNQFCVEQAIRTGLALNGKINLFSRFDRKSYFYADLPAGYQISQFYHPIMRDGYLEVEMGENVRRVGIERLHMEQDAGKSIHDQSPTHSYIDLNRAGIALMEIVSRPDMRSADEAVAYLKKLRTLVRYLGTCDGNMEEGSFRADINISLRRPGAPLGVRAEIKNVNSFRFVHQAILYEMERQKEILEEGGQVIQETRLYDPTTGTTRPMRSKEDAHDYRYAPDPDLLPIRLTQEKIDQIACTLPELPDAKRERFIREFGLTPYEAGQLIEEVQTAEFFEAGVRELSPEEAKSFAHLMLGDFFAALNREGKDVAQSPVTPAQLAELVKAQSDGTISGRMAKDIFLAMWAERIGAEEVINRQGLRQVSDVTTIDPIIDKILILHQDKVEEYRSGKDKLFGFFVGQVMKAMEGKGNPNLVNDRLKFKLQEYGQDRG